MERTNNDESKDLMKLIQMRFPRLSKGQKLIAEYILKNYDKAAFMTAAKLGVSVGVSESTVVRFAIELGFSGYPKLQKSLQELIKNCRSGCLRSYGGQGTRPPFDTRIIG